MKSIWTVVIGIALMIAGVLSLLMSLLKANPKETETQEAAAGFKIDRKKQLITWLAVLMVIAGALLQFFGQYG